MFIRAFALLVGAALGANCLWLASNANFNQGVVAEGVLALVLLLFAVFRKVAAIRWLAALALAFALVVAGFSAFFVSQGVSDNATGDEDAIVVLGAAVHGTEVSPVLAARLDVAYAYHQRNPAALVIVSGGQGFQEEISEAAAMRAYLISKGVPADQIVAEDRSATTVENFAFSKEILDARFPEGYKFAFATNEYHVFRSLLIAQRLGLSPTHLHSSTQWYTWMPSCLRESVVLAITWFFPNL
jgi:uncharacterized SAM-binding protein YcdF (DUF218 family)